MNSVLAFQDSDVVPSAIPPSTLSSLPTIEEAPDEEQIDYVGSVEFDLLDHMDSLGVTDTNKIVTPYSSLKFPLGSVHGILSSQVTVECCPSSDVKSFQLIMDSGCTCRMFPFRSVFILYKATPCSHVVLAGKSKVACLGSGTVKFSPTSRTLMLHDVLHIPTLHSPLLSVCCFRQYCECSFLADNQGSFLTFPKFVLPVDDSSDCMISGSDQTYTTLHCDSWKVGTVAAVSDNTRHRHQRRPPTSPTSSHPTPQGPSITTTYCHYHY